MLFTFSCVYSMETYVCLKIYVRLSLDLLASDAYSSNSTTYILFNGAIDGSLLVGEQG